MTDPNEALEDALRELETCLPGDRLHVQITCTKAFRAKRCFARFRIEGGPLFEVEIPLKPGFNMARWLSENLPAGTRH